MSLYARWWDAPLEWLGVLISRPVPPPPPVPPKTLDELHAEALLDDETFEHERKVAAERQRLADEYRERQAEQERVWQIERERRHQAAREALLEAKAARVRQGLPPVEPAPAPAPPPVQVEAFIRPPRHTGAIGTGVYYPPYVSASSLPFF